MTKEHIVIEIYKVQNQLNELTGKPLADLSDNRMKGKMYEESLRSSKPELESRLTNIQEQLERTRKKVAYEKMVADFYATPGGMEHKAQTEEEIEELISGWKEYDRTMVDFIEQRIQQDLGVHWGVSRFNKGFLEIGVIDAEKSTPDRREFFFGQTIDIRYEEKKYGVGGEVFESGCCSCGSFDMAGGGIVGERAMFYVGIGQLYGKPELVDFLKVALRDSARQIDALSNDLDVLRRILSHPVPETDEVE